MRLILTLLLILPLVFSGDLPEFTNDDFEVQIKQKEFILIMFYAPWCGHCKKLKPDFISAGEKLMNNKDVGLALVDCTTQEKLCSRFDISGYPTLKLFKNGQFHLNFDGPRDENGIMNFVLSHSQPPSIELQSKDQLEDLLNNEVDLIKPVLVSFIRSKDDKLTEIHSKVASDLLGLVTFAHTHDTTILGETFNDNVVRLYRPKKFVTKLTEPFIDFSGKIDAESLRVWISKNGYGLVGYRSRSNQNLFPSDDILIFYHNASINNYPKGVNYYQNRIIQAINESGISLTKLTFVYSYSEDFFREMEDWKPTSMIDPLITIRSKSKKYKLEGYSYDRLLEFIKSFDAGTLEPYIKSEPIPTEQTKSALKVVGYTFDSIVNDPNKDVFIMFYAPWCGHCKQLMPKFEAVADTLKNEPGLVLVTYDATENDVPYPYSVQGYPTLYFVPKASKNSPKHYKGSREEKDLIEYIAKESSEELQAYDRSGTEKKSDL